MTDERYKEKCEFLHRSFKEGRITYHAFLSGFDRLDKLARKQLIKEKKS